MKNYLCMIALVAAAQLNCTETMTITQTATSKQEVPTSPPASAMQPSDRNTVQEVVYSSSSYSQAPVRNKVLAQGGEKQLEKERCAKCYFCCCVGIFKRR